MMRMVNLSALWLIAAGCLPVDDRNTCEQAELLLHRCGVQMALLDGPCVGARIGAAECVLEHASDCTEVATLGEHVDECLISYGEDLSGDIDGTVPTVLPNTVPGIDATWEDTNDLCSDGVDNDLDGFTDCADADCSDGAGVSVCDVDTGF